MSAGVPLSASGRIAADITADIEAGVLQPGDPVPSEASIMQRYDCARGTARLAIAALRSAGLVVTVAGRGSFVLAPSDRLALQPGDVVTVPVSGATLSRDGEVRHLPAGVVLHVPEEG